MRSSTKWVSFAVMATLVAGRFWMDQSAPKPVNDHAQVSAKHAPRFQSASPMPSSDSRDSQSLAARSPQPVRNAEQPAVEAPITDEPVYRSFHQKFVEELKRSQPQETRVVQDPELKAEVRESLYHTPKGDFAWVTLREVLQSDGSVDRTTVQTGNHILVQFEHDLSQTELRQFLSAQNLKLKQKLLLPATYTFELPQVSLAAMDKVREKVAAWPSVSHRVPNMISFAAAVPNDPSMGKLWGFINKGVDSNGRQGNTAGMDIQVEKVWDRNTDCSKIPVAVFDTGIDYNHPDLRDNIVHDLGRDFTTNDPKDYMDRNSHGTHVSGSIGAVGNNGVGVAGVCWKAKIIGLKVLSDGGGGTDEGIINALMYASTLDIRVGNMSLAGAHSPSVFYEQAIAAFTSKNKILVVAAANDNTNIDSKPYTPASSKDPLVMTVAAMDGKGAIAGFSNYGERDVEIASPGVDILSTIPLSKANNNAAQAYASYQGTSMASPVTAGAVALFWSLAPNLTARQVYDEFLAAADRGNFTKPVNNNRRTNTLKSLDVLTPKASFDGIMAGSSLAVDANGFVKLDLKYEGKYGKIASAEVLDGMNVVGAGNSGTIFIQTPFADSINVSAVVKNEDGFSYTTPPMEIKLAINKTMDLSSLKLEAEEDAETVCQLDRVDSMMNKTVIFSSPTSDEAVCQRLCETLIPTVYTNQGTVECALVAGVKPTPTPTPPADDEAGVAP